MNRISIVLLIVVFLFTSCSERAKPSVIDKKAEEVRTTPTASDSKKLPKETTISALLNGKDQSELKYISTFLENGESIMDLEYGDLNKDEYKKDIIVIGYNPKKEEDQNIDYDIPRTTYILTRTADGKLKKEAINQNTAICAQCGGVFGDPYNQIVIKNGYFSLEHYGGSNWRWMTVVTFKYNSDKNNWYLSSEGHDSYHTNNPDKIESQRKTVKDFGEIKFLDYEEIPFE